MTQIAHIFTEAQIVMPSDSSRTQDLDPIESGAQFMAAQSGAAERILAKHTRRDDGRCAQCSTRTLVTWPCTLANIANRAHMISAGRSAHQKRQSRHP